MKLLIFTQKIDKSDPGLGFFHRWVEVFSEKYESVIVICLYKGESDLPPNVKVLSLGKEGGESRWKYIKNFYKYIFAERKNYERVFVHMNQEYVLLGGIFWKILGKKVFMWRNHHAGSILTDMAVAFCTKVFCTSKFSYTAKYKKTEFMPVGVDLENFKPTSVNRPNNSIVSIGRISPSKNIDVLVDAISKIDSQNLKVSIYGDALPVDIKYYEDLKNKAPKGVNFYKGIPNIETVKVYSENNIFVNLSSSGMYDKTIFEAMACGCIVIVSNDNLRGNINDDFIFKNRDTLELVEKLNKVLNYTEDEKTKARTELLNFAKEHSLNELKDRLFEAMK